MAKKRLHWCIGNKRFATRKEALHYHRKNKLNTRIMMRLTKYVIGSDGSVWFPCLTVRYVYFPIDNSRGVRK